MPSIYDPVFRPTKFIVPTTIYSPTNPINSAVLQIASGVSVDGGFPNYKMDNLFNDLTEWIADNVNDKIAAVKTLVDGIPAVKTLVDGIPAVKTLVDGIPAIKTLVDTLPDISDVIAGIPDIKELVDGIPDIKALADELPGIVTQAGTLITRTVDLGAGLTNIGSLITRTADLITAITKIGTIYDELVLALQCPGEYLTAKVELIKPYLLSLIKQLVIVILSGAEV